MMINKEVFLRLVRYILIGGLTTIVSFGVFSMLYYLFRITPNIANSLSVACAVIFAYIANKKIVFRSKCNTVKELIYEMGSFLLSRAFTVVLEIGGVFVLYTLLHVEAMLAKIIISLLVLLVNYILSQFIFLRTRDLSKGENKV